MAGLTGKLPDIDPLGGDPALDRLLRDIRHCRLCEARLPLGPRPVVRMGHKAAIMVIGQAPGTKVHQTGLPWNDASGDRLRAWLDVTVDEFYDPDKFAIMPMGFCYPGRYEKGGDLPPEADCAPLWHDVLRAHLPNIRLTLLIGQYAQAYYLGKKRFGTMTDTVRHFDSYLSQEMFPMPHPSWRNIGWAKRNPWYETDLLPVLRHKVRCILSDNAH